MLARIYIEALLVDKDLADQVWETCFANLADDQTAAIAWSLVARGAPSPSKHPYRNSHEADLQYRHNPKI